MAVCNNHHVTLAHREFEMDQVGQFGFSLVCEARQADQVGKGAILVVGMEAETLVGK
jgi:hypothetical protein